MKDWQIKENEWLFLYDEKGNCILVVKLDEEQIKRIKHNKEKYDKIQISN